MQLFGCSLSALVLTIIGFYKIPFQQLPQANSGDLENGNFR